MERASFAGSRGADYFLFAQLFKLIENVEGSYYDYNLYYVQSKNRYAKNPLLKARKFVFFGILRMLLAFSNYEKHGK